MSKTTGIKFVSPATISFYSFGLENLSVAIENPTNEIIARPDSSFSGIKIEGFSHAKDDKLNTRELILSFGNAFCEKFNIAAGTAIDFNNRIPFEAGIGSTESNITGLISALNELHKIHLDKGSIFDFISEISEKSGCNINLSSIAANLFGGFISYDPVTAKKIHKIFHPKGLYFSSFFFPKNQKKEKYNPFLISSEYTSGLISLINGLIISDLELISSSLKNNRFLIDHPKENSHFDEISRFSIDNGALGIGFTKNFNSIIIIYPNTVIKDFNNEKIEIFLNENKTGITLFDSGVSLNGLYKS